MCYVYMCISNSTVSCDWMSSISAVELSSTVLCRSIILELYFNGVPGDVRHRLVKVMKWLGLKIRNSEEVIM